jgi:hypothetical protein
MLSLSKHEGPIEALRGWTAGLPSARASCDNGRPMSAPRAFLALAVAALVLAVSDARAAPKEKDTTAYVQLGGITAVVASASGSRGSVPATVVLRLATAAANDICRGLPAVRAAILATSGRSPIPFANGKLDSDAVGTLFAREIEAAAQTKGVVRVGFIHGQPKDVADTSTDVVDPGDVTGKQQNIKSGGGGKNPPCRRIAAPPRDLGWPVAAKPQPATGKEMEPPPPPLRDPQAQTPARPAPAFETHPQFAPRKQ